MNEWFCSHGDSLSSTEQKWSGMAAPGKKQQDGKLLAGKFKSRKNGI